MAFNIQKINPLDLQPRKAVGVKLPFLSRSVFTQTYTTQDALKSNLINFLLTNKGERFLNPNFGADIRALLFEQITSEIQDTVSAVIRTGIQTWFSNVRIQTLNVIESPDTNTITIYMKYTVDFTNIQDELVINFQQ
jgi:phage baseplate assembly protein W